jgi:hypothetical protein
MIVIVEMGGLGGVSNRKLCGITLYKRQGELIDSLAKRLSG